MPPSVVELTRTTLLIVGALFPIVNPPENIPIFLTLTSGLRSEDRSLLARKVAIYGFTLLVASVLIGTHVLAFFGISLPVLKIAGGLIVANTAWGMVTSHARITPEESYEAQGKDDISLTPLAMPLMSGPGAIGVVMGLAAHVDSAASYMGIVIGIAGVALSVLLFFWLGGPLVRRLGPSAVGAINKIFGFLILAIAVQLVWDGVADFNS